MTRSEPLTCSCCGRPPTQEDDYFYVCLHCPGYFYKTAAQWNEAQSERGALKRREIRQRLDRLKPLLDEGGSGVFDLADFAVNALEIALTEWQSAEAQFIDATEEIERLNNQLDDRTGDHD